MKTLFQTKKESNLIFDVGLHLGEDTAYYLKCGFRVIAIEADSELVEKCRIRFKDEISNSQLIIVEGAISDEESKTVKFFKNKNVSVWGTVVNNWAKRNEFLGTQSELIEVNKIDFKECLIKYGIPFYLKVDIEGMDMVCLRELLEFENKPDYISVESDKLSFEKIRKEFELLKKLGYSKFKAINQADVPNQNKLIKDEFGDFQNYLFEEGSSGLFGEETPKKWKSHKQIILEYRKIFFFYKLFGDYGIAPKKIKKRLLKIFSSISQETIPGWYDTHAKHDNVI